MRARITVIGITALAFVLLPVASLSNAKPPARFSAEAALVHGKGAPVAKVQTHDRAVSREERQFKRHGIVIKNGRVSVVANQDGPRATVATQSIDLLDGLITADGVQQTAETLNGVPVYIGMIRNLRVDGRFVGDIDTDEEFQLRGGQAKLTINREGTALRLRLNRPLNGHAAGTEISIAQVGVDDRRPDQQANHRPNADQSSKQPATPAQPTTPMEIPIRPGQLPERRRPPTVKQRLTRHQFAFPVYGEASVANNFGAARADTGSHAGNDIFANFGAPVVAVSDGVIEKVGTLHISGNRLWLRNRAGDTFFYAHLSAFSTHAYNGHRVKAGDVLGFVGNTGDAEPTPPHLHFEIHPGDKEAIDPFHILTSWQQRRDVAPSAWLTRYGSDTGQRPGALVEIRDFIAGD